MSTQQQEPEQVWSPEELDRLIPRLANVAARFLFWAPVALLGTGAIVTPLAHGPAIGAGIAIAFLLTLSGFAAAAGSNFLNPEMMSHSKWLMALVAAVLVVIAAVVVAPAFATAFGGSLPLAAVAGILAAAALGCYALGYLIRNAALEDARAYRVKKDAVVSIAKQQAAAEAMNLLTSAREEAHAIVLDARERRSAVTSELDEWSGALATARTEAERVAVELKRVSEATIKEGLTVKMTLDEATAEKQHAVALVRAAEERAQRIEVEASLRAAEIVRSAEEQTAAATPPVDSSVAVPPKAREEELDRLLSSGQ